MSDPCPKGNVNIPLEIQTKPEKRTCLCPRGPGHVGSRRVAGKSAEFALATDRFLAPLICRVVLAVRVLRAGLGFPVGEPSVLHPQPPIDIIDIDMDINININIDMDIMDADVDVDMDMDNK